MCFNFRHKINAGHLIVATITRQNPVKRVELYIIIVCLFQTMMHRVRSANRNIGITLKTPLRWVVIIELLKLLKLNYGVFSLLLLFKLAFC